MTVNWVSLRRSARKYPNIYNYVEQIRPRANKSDDNGSPFIYKQTYDTIKASIRIWYNVYSDTLLNLVRSSTPLSTKEWRRCIPDSPVWCVYMVAIYILPATPFTMIDRLSLFKLRWDQLTTGVWRIELSYINIREYKGRSKGRVRDTVSQTRPFDGPLYSRMFIYEKSIFHAHLWDRIIGL